MIQDTMVFKIIHICMGYTYLQYTVYPWLSHYNDYKNIDHSKDYQLVEETNVF